MVASGCAIVVLLMNDWGYWSVLLCVLVCSVGSSRGECGEGLVYSYK